MDLDKLNTGMSAMNNALGALEKSIELGQQTSRFRNILTKNDLDQVSVACVATIKKLNEELNKILKNE